MVILFVFGIVTNLYFIWLFTFSATIYFYFTTIWMQILYFSLDFIYSVALVTSYFTDCMLHESRNPDNCPGPQYAIYIYMTIYVYFTLTSLTFIARNLLLNLYQIFYISQVMCMGDLDFYQSDILTWYHYLYSTMTLGYLLQHCRSKLAWQWLSRTSSFYDLILKLLHFILESAGVTSTDSRWYKMLLPGPCCTSMVTLKLILRFYSLFLKLWMVWLLPISVIC